MLSVDTVTTASCVYWEARSGCSWSGSDVCWWLSQSCFCYRFPAEGRCGCFGWKLLSPPIVVSAMAEDAVSSSMAAFKKSGEPDIVLEAWKDIQISQAGCFF